MIGSVFTSHPRRRQAGIGMIEVLIAVLVVSIGFLGMAALQAKALSTNNSAAARSMATIATYSILDAMRADIVNAGNGKYNVTNMKASSCPAGTGSLAASQLNAWCIQLGHALGAVATTLGTVACTGSAATSVDCKVTIQFDDSRGGAKGCTKGDCGKQQVVTEAGL